MSEDKLRRVDLRDFTFRLDAIKGMNNNRREQKSIWYPLWLEYISIYSPDTDDPNGLVAFLFGVSPFFIDLNMRFKLARSILRRFLRICPDLSTSNTHVCPTSNPPRNIAKKKKLLF